MTKQRKTNNDPHGKTNGSQSGNPTASTRSTGGRANARRPECDPASVRAKAQKETVLLSTIDFEDSSFANRDQTGSPCGSDDFLVEKDGVVDGSYGEDPIVLLDRAGTDKMQIIAGWSRLLQMKENPKIRGVIALVLRDISDEEAAIYAARANLSHGRMLTKPEKRRCFDQEQAAIAAGKFACPSICALARIYGVSRNTIKKWLRARNARGPHVSSARRSPGTVERHVRVNVERTLAEFDAALQMFVEALSDEALSEDTRTNVRGFIVQLNTLVDAEGQEQEAAA